MRLEAHLIEDSGFGFVILRGRWRAFPAGALLLVLAAGAQPCGQSRLNQNPAAPAGQAPVQASVASQPVVPTPAPVQSLSSPKDQRMAAQNAALLKMATELKAEVDKSNKDTLSLAVIRKADEIERTARSMKDKYRVSAGIN